MLTETLSQLQIEEEEKISDSNNEERQLQETTLVSEPQAQSFWYEECFKSLKLWIYSPSAPKPVKLAPGSSQNPPKSAPERSKKSIRAKLSAP